MYKYFRIKGGHVTAEDVVLVIARSGRKMYEVEHEIGSRRFEMKQLIENPTKEERMEGDARYARKHQKKYESLMAALDEDRIAKEILKP